MKPPCFVYHRPATLPEAVDLLSRLDNVRILAGGQSLMPMLNMRFSTPDHVVDINGIPSLAGIEKSGSRIVIGSMSRQRDIEFDPVISEYLPIMSEAIKFVGHRQTRNRGTIGGSLCHMDPAAELVCIAAVYNAEVRVAGSAGERTIQFADFPQGYLTPAIEQGDIVTSIAFDPWPAKSGFGFVEFARRHGDFAIASAGALLSLDDAGRIARCALAMGGIGTAPVRMTSIETALVGEHPSDAIFEELADACHSLDIVDDPYVPAAYRKRLCAGQAAIALKTAQSRAVANVHKAAMQ